jgi:hypothetical protein
MTQQKPPRKDFDSWSRSSISRPRSRCGPSVAEGPPTNLAPFDVDDVVRAWRQRR